MIDIWASKSLVPTVQAAWSLHHLQNHTLLGHSPPASQAGRHVGPVLQPSASLDVSHVNMCKLTRKTVSKCLREQFGCFLFYYSTHILSHLSKQFCHFQSELFKNFVKKFSLYQGWPRTNAIILCKRIFRKENHTYRMS